jgi:hypothetical protein
MTDNTLKLKSEALVIALVGKANAELWWNNYNEYFNAIPSKLPVQQVYDYLMAQGGGAYQ